MQYNNTKDTEKLLKIFYSDEYGFEEEELSKSLKEVVKYYDKHTRHQYHIISRFVNERMQEGEDAVSYILNNIDFSKLYNRVSIISTNSYIFNGTIKDNLLIAKKNATLEEINYALKKANLLDFVNSKKEKLDLEVGEGGSKLSGGQKQRLALARTILANREVIIFDEATSNIDVESENMIWKSINEISKEKTVIVISHRLANVKNADRIYMLDKGILVEEGSHKDLMERKNKYYGMVNYQNELEIGGVI